jgi:dihydroorotate dehydrogenase (NAD+) catalytic subunit
MVDLSVKIGSLILDYPVIAASGTFGYANEYEDFINLSGIGAVITKGITLEPRSGNPQPRIKEVLNGMINSIGLENIGIYRFIQEKIPILEKNKINYILNIAGESIEEYRELGIICQENNIKALELNLSCPNLDKGCLEFGKDEGTVLRLVSGVREVFKGTLIIKLGSNVSFPERIAKTAQDSGADAISAINTVKAMSVSVNDNYKGYKFVKGGMSGICIKPIALNYIFEIKKHITIPIIGMGGIYSLNDTLEFFAVGADALQVGTANFTHPNLIEKLVFDLKNFMVKHDYTNLNRLMFDLRTIMAD